MRKEIKPLPSESKAWLKEIAAAYLDAEEAIPFGPAAGAVLTKKDLLHLGPPYVSSSGVLNDRIRISRK
ncbi:MAG: hypothetical protein M0R70_14270 [Nitrospirae bacterium]|nr:hypothetical protein [Nitrospirota bacterium]